MTEVRRLLWRLYAGWCLAVAASAAATSLCFAPAARRTLRVHFLFAFHHPLGEAGTIFLTNSRATVGVAGCVAAMAVIERISPAGSVIERIPLWLCDGIMFVTAARAALLAGILIGAYGSPQLRAFLPNGPVEVLAWALLVCVYIQVRRRRLALRESAIGLLTVEVLLALAALLEAFL